MRPDVKVSGVLGLVEVLMITTFAVPVQTPLTEITSPLCTSEKLIFPLLLMLCIIAGTPLRNRYCRGLSYATGKCKVNINRL